MSFEDDLKRMAIDPPVIRMSYEDRQKAIAKRFHEDFFYSVQQGRLSLFAQKRCQQCPCCQLYNFLKKILSLGKKVCS